MAQYGSGSLPFSYTDFSGGLNSLNAPDLLTDNQARDLSNVQGTTAGAIVKRGGLVTIAQPADTLTSLFALESVTPIILVGAGGTSLYSITAGGVVTAIKTGLTNNLRWSFCSAPQIAGQGPLFGMNGTDTPQRWTGSGSTADWTATDAGGTVPNGTMCLYHNNQVFVAGVPTNKGTQSTLYWSAIGDPTGWNPGNSLGAGSEQFDPWDGQPITGIGVVGPYVLVTKARKLWILINPGTGQSRQLSDSVGCVAHRSIAQGDAGTYFLSEDRGVYVTNGSTLTPISDQIVPTFKTVITPANAAGVFFDAHYYLSVNLGGVPNDTTLDFDEHLSGPHQSSWWKHSFGSNKFAVWHPSGSAQLFSAKSTAAYVDRCFDSSVFQDNGANFTWTWRGPWQSPSFYRRRRFPTTYFRKRLRQFRVEGSGHVDFLLAKDYAVGETLVRSDVFSYVDSLAAPEVTFGGAGVFGAADDSLFGGIPQFTRNRFHSLGVANAFGVVFSGTSAHPALLTSYVLLLTDRRDMIVA